MRILWIGPNYAYRYNSVHESLPRAMVRHADVTRWGQAMESGPACAAYDAHLDIKRVVKDRGPFDVCVLQHPRHCSHYQSLAEIGIPLAVLVTDYFPRNWTLKNKLFSKIRPNLVLFPETSMVSQARYFQSRGEMPANVTTEWLPFWADTDRFRKWPDIACRYDVMALFSGDHSGSYPNREVVVSTLAAMNSPECRVFARVVRGHRDKIIGDAYPALINRSYSAVTSCDRWGSVNFKVFEYSACHTPWLSDAAHDYEALGFKPGIHYLQYSSPEDLKDQVTKLISSWALRERLHSAAHDLVMSRHTATHRAKNLLDLLAKIV